MTMDKACVASALLFLVGNLVTILGVITEKVPSLDVSKWKELDVDYIKRRWQTDAHGLEVIGGLLVAMAWFVFTIPMIQLAWVLSRGGKRNVPLHTMMVLLVIAGSFTELIARLLQMGMWGILGWVSKDFNISDWIESSDNTGSSDNIGWKTLELISTVIRGMTFWVDAFEWLALSGITIAIVISVRTLPTSSNVVIPKAWPYLTFLLICCCIVEFISDVLRMLDWTTFQTIAIIFSLVTTIILLPVWLLVLGSWLPAATPTYNQKTDDFYANSCMSMEPDVREPEVNKGEDTDNALAIV